MILIENWKRKSAVLASNTNATAKSSKAPFEKNKRISFAVVRLAAVLKLELHCSSRSQSGRLFIAFIYP